MTRLLYVFAALAALASVASAQPRALPLSPGVMPGSSIGPGTQFLPQPTPRFVPTSRNSGITAMARSGDPIGFGSSRNFYGYGTGFGYGYGGYGYGGYGYGGGYGYPNISIETFGGPSFIPVLPPQPNVVLANEFPATLTIQLPPGKDMKVNGKTAEDTPAGYTLTSPALPSGEKYTFKVDVRWQSGGKTYEARRVVTVGAGERSRLLIVSGEEVDE